MTIKNIKSKDEFVTSVSKGYSLVDFHALWCGPCKMLSPVIENVSKVASDLKYIKIDIDQFVDLAHQFNVQSVPTVYLFKDGKPVSSFVGYKPEPQVLEFINQNKR